MKLGGPDKGGARVIADQPNPDCGEEGVKDARVRGGTWRVDALGPKCRDDQWPKDEEHGDEHERDRSMAAETDAEADRLTEHGMSAREIAAAARGVGAV